MTGSAALNAIETFQRDASPERRKRLSGAWRLFLPVLQSDLERARPRQTRLRLIGTLFGRASNVFMVAIAAFICGSAIWVRGGGWLGAAIAGGEVAILLARCAVIVGFDKRKRVGTLSDPAPWLVAFGLLAIASSMSWGALCFLCLAFSNDPVLYVIPVLSTVGTAGAVAARNSGVPRLAKIQLACSLSPILLGCLFAEDHGFRLLLLLVPAMATGLLILIAERNQQLVELIETQAELARLSQTDELTQVPNRRYFDARIDELAARPGRSFALLMIDVDDFKTFNDHHGHPAGDALLRHVASVLQKNLRGDDDVLARYGGEEFVILLDHADITVAATIGERLRNGVQACRMAPAGESITISVGAAAGTADPASIIADADCALYRAKRLGRNRVEAAGLSEGMPHPDIVVAA